MQSQKPQVTKKSKGTDSDPTKPHIRSIYDRKHIAKIKDYGPSRTDQQFKDDNNPENVIARYKLTGIIGTGQGTRQPQFGDFTNVDFQAMQNKVVQANEAFEELPNALRKKFGNKVDAMISWLENTENRAEAIKMGLIDKPAEKESAEDKPLTLNQLRKHQKDPFSTPETPQGASEERPQGAPSGPQGQ